MAEEGDSYDEEIEMQGTELGRMPDDLLDIISSWLEWPDRLAFRLASKRICSAVGRSGRGKRDDFKVTIKNKLPEEEVWFIEISTLDSIIFRVHKSDFVEFTQFFNSMFGIVHFSRLELNVRHLTQKDLANVDAWIEQCNLDRLEFRMERTDFTPWALDFLHRHETEKLAIHMGKFFMNRDQLLSFPNPIEFAHGRFSKYVYHQTLWDLDDEMLLEMTRRGHTLSDVPARIQSNETIFELMKIVSRSKIDQFVMFPVSRETRQEFYERIGVQEMEDDFRILPESENVTVRVTHNIEGMMSSPIGLHFDKYTIKYENALLTEAFRNQATEESVFSIERQHL